MNLSIAFSPCPNDTFIFEALVHQRIDQSIQWDVHLEDIKTLNQWASEAKFDVIKVSFHAFAYLMDKYELLPYGAALGRGVGPLLIAKNYHSIHALKGKRIGIPGKLTTANFLFDFANDVSIDKEYLLFHEIEDRVLDGSLDAGVIIHENRFTYAEKGLTKIKDLGKHWEETTGYAIPLGGIVVRKSLDIELKKQIAQNLKASIDYAYQHESTVMEYVKKHAQTMKPEVMKQHIALYVNEFTRSLGTEGTAAVQFLLEKIHQNSEKHITNKFYMLNF